MVDWILTRTDDMKFHAARIVHTGKNEYYYVNWISGDFENLMRDVVSMLNEKHPVEPYDPDSIF